MSKTNNSPETACSSGSSPPLQTCTSCNIQKPISDFYKKGSQQESNCKECKKAKRNARDAKRTAGEVQRNVPFISSPPIETVVENTHFRPRIEPRSELKFDLWERNYGRSLSTSEKSEICSNMKNFFSALLEEVKG
jgi:hypothetical protein